MAHTKSSAIERSILVWTWLSQPENEGKHKDDAYLALGFATLDMKGELPNDVDESLCACCQYAREQTATNKTTPICDLCPVWSEAKPCIKSHYGRWIFDIATAKLVLAEILEAKERLDKEEGK
jgi:hypothetical protein